MTKTAQPLGIGIIGGGFIARFHIKSWVGVRDADILGVFDPDAKRAREACALARSLGVGEAEPYASITKMAADPRIGALWICAPNFTRGEVMEEIAHAVVKGQAELTGVACEKPLGRNAREARKMLELVRKAGLLDGYLENQVFSPAVVRGKEIVWARGAALSGPPYLARAAEEHSGPHMPWFWEGTLQGGGVLNDMMCHSVEEARYMLTPPGAPREVLTPVSVTAYTNCLKWQEPKYAAILAKNSGGKTDYLTRPSEDFARSLVEYKDRSGKTLVVETTTSWCYVGAGLRLSMELLGPEYALQINTLDAGLKVFFSRAVRGQGRRGPGREAERRDRADARRPGRSRRIRIHGREPAHGPVLPQGRPARGELLRRRRRGRAAHGRLPERRARQDRPLPLQGPRELRPAGGPGQVEPEIQVRDQEVP